MKNVCEAFLMVCTKIRFLSKQNKVLSRHPPPRPPSTKKKKKKNIKKEQEKAKSCHISPNEKNERVRVCMSVCTCVCVLPAVVTVFYSSD